MRFIWRYQGAAREFITSMKYRPSLKLCTLAAHELAQSVFELFPFPDWDIIVPLPSSSLSLKTRCFNQCLILARALHFVLKGRSPARLEPSALHHTGGRHPQASLAHNLRIHNVQGVFKAQAHKVRGAHVLLVDDVITTGATSAAAAAALIQAGAGPVDLIALARAQVWEEYRHEIYRRIPRRIAIDS